MIGAFYQPRAVLADIETLDTLPDRELRAGIAEIIKYGLIRDLVFLEWIERNIQGMLARDAAILTEAIERSCVNKAEVVAADERESGVRALLNLGHTFGHAIENAMGYGVWLHGEAVAQARCCGGPVASDGHDRTRRCEANQGALRSGRASRVAPNLGAETYLRLDGAG